MNKFNSSLASVTKVVDKGANLDATYFAIEAYSSSFFKSYLKQPDYTLSKFFNQRALEEKQTKSKMLGSIIHKVLLEDKKLSDYNALLTGKDRKALPLMLDGVTKNKVILNIFNDGMFREKVFTWPEYYGEKKFPCKCKVDLFTNEGFLFDIKTCSSLADMESHIDKYRYDLQLSFYESGVENHLNQSVKNVGLIAIETTPPYRNHIFELGESYLERGRKGGFIRNKRVKGWWDILEELSKPKDDDKNFITKLEC